MADRNCLGVEELAEVLAADPDDPRRRHLAACPRCRALAAEYAGFMEEDESQEGLSSAELSRLDAALKREMTGGDQPVTHSRPRTTGLARWWVAVPALAAVIALFFVFPWLGDLGSDRSVMRGAEQPETHLILNPVTDTGSGMALLSWQARDGIDAYEVQLLAGDLSRLLVLPAAPGTVREVAWASVRGPAPCRFWRVVGYREGIQVIQSELQEFPQ